MVLVNTRRIANLAHGSVAAASVFMARITNAAAPGAVILNYHSVGDPTRQGAFPGNCIPALTFRKQMEFVREECHPITLDELELALRGESQLPRRAVAVTFDDGYRGVIEEAQPIMKELDIVATVFLPTDLIASGRDKWEDRLSAAILRTSAETLDVDIPGAGKTECDISRYADRLAIIDRLCMPLSHLPANEIEERVDRITASCEVAESRRALMTADDVRRFTREGKMRFGSHSASHHLLASLDRSELRADLARSRDQVSAWTESPCRHFAYPFGGIDAIGPDAPAMLAEIGYTMALTTVEGFANPGDDMFMLRRTLVHPRDTLAVFELKALGKYDLFVRTRERAKAIRNWRNIIS